MKTTKKSTSAKKTSSIPRWNLDSLYSSIQSPEYKQALADYKSGMDNIDALLQTAKDFTRTANQNFDFAAWLASYIEEDNKVTALAGTLNGYAYAIYSTDTTNTSYLNNISLIEEMGLRAQQQDISFKSLLVAHTKYLDEFYKRFPKYESYKYLIQERIEETAHQMSPAEENLASDLQRTGGDAWSRLHEQIISNLKDETGKTFNGLRNDAFSPDPIVRKSSWEKEISLLKQNEIAFAACLNNLKGETVTLNKRRHWNEAIDRALASSRMSRKTLDALITAVEESLPTWREYLKTKAAMLRKAGATASKTAGTAKETGIAFYDLFAPLADKKTAKARASKKTASSDKNSLLSRTWTFAEARDYIIERYSSFSPAMGAFAKKAFDSKWIDAEVHSGNVGAAYDQDFAKGHQSRILSNFTGAFSDIVTLAHEIGHAYHFSCMKGKDVAFFDYPMTLAETASTFAETIVKQDVISKSEGFDKKKIIEMDLQDVCQVLVDILCRFYFERSVFEERTKGELSAQDFCRLMRDAQKKSDGSGLDSARQES